ncbi:hypothetical protein BJX76DRAFT_326284 [Aspergillus varians]
MDRSQVERLTATKRSIMRVNPQRPQRNAASSRRHRTAVSCTPCRNRKVKCDRLKPCAQCMRLSIENACTYSQPPTTPPFSPPGSDPAYSVRRRHVEDVRNPDPTLYLVDRRGTSVTSASVGGREESIHDADSGTTPERASRTSQPSHSEHPVRSAPADATIQTLAPMAFRGKRQRTRFFGRSHWATTLATFPDLNAHLHAYYQDKQSQINPELAEYMSLRRLKHELRGPSRRWQLDRRNPHASKLKDLLPDRRLAEDLMQLYFSTFEYTIRILHVPSFLEEWNGFWNQTETQPDRSFSPEVFIAKLLALMACSGCFATGGQLELAGLNRQSFMEMCHSWMEAVAEWLGVMTGHAQLCLDVVQVKCLLLLSQQATAWQGDLAGLAAGSLVREALLMGLHRDPSNFAHISPYWAEMRKRLWFTIVELELQASLYNGIPLAISWDEFDCPLPSNIDDEDFSVDSVNLPSSKPSTTFTRTTFQIVLAQTLRTRMAVSRVINRVRLSVPYEEVMKLSESLSAGLADAPPELRDINHRGASAEALGSCPEFQRSFFLFLNYRCLLALHRPFFLRLAETRDEPFVFSRRVCVQISLALLAQLEYTPGSSPSDGLVNSKPSCPHILQLKGGMFRDDVFHAAATICFELRLQAKDKVIDPFPGTISGYMNQSAFYQRMALFEGVERAIQYFELKVRTEKRATKVFNILTILFTSIKSQVLAAESYPHPDGQSDGSVLTMDDACPAASRRCRELLLADTTPAPTPSGTNVERPLHPPQDQAQAATTQSSSETSGQQTSFDLVQAVLQDTQASNLQNLDLDWYFSLDPLSPYPLNTWPDLDPFLV